MKQEDKKLLLKDLCARLPYGMKAQVCERNDEDGSYFYNNCEILGIKSNSLVEFIRIDDSGKKYGRSDWFNISWFKPYLFPLSSLTEEQRNDISRLLIDTQNKFSPYGKLNLKGCDNLFICTVKQANALINYCLTYHLDINGLIEKGLAIDATGLNIY